MGLDMWSGAATLGLDGLLFLADIGLAAGAKMEVIGTLSHFPNVLVSCN